MTTVSSRVRASFEHDVAQRQEVSDRDIHFSRLSGIYPSDVDVLSDFSREEGLLIVIRCPKRPARYFHGRFKPKPSTVKTKSNPGTGLVTEHGVTYVSDYDLMCVWRSLGSSDYEQVLLRALDDARPLDFGPEVNQLMDKLQYRLESKIQHGAQDTFFSTSHPNVTMKSDGGKLVDRFMVFNLGLPSYVCNGAELKKVYDRLLGPDAWPYDENGVHGSNFLGQA